MLYISRKDLSSSTNIILAILIIVYNTYAKKSIKTKLAAELAEQVRLAFVAGQLEQELVRVPVLVLV